MLEKNQELEVEIVDYSSEGHGVAKAGGFVIFVPFTIVGERAVVHIIKVNKSFAIAKLVKLISVSKERVQPKCPHFTKCGGCALQHMSYSAQLAFKKRQVEIALEKLGGFRDVKVENVTLSKSEYFYRNKSAFPLFLDAEGKLEICMFRPLSHNPIYISECPITQQQNIQIAFAFKDAVNEFLNDSKKYMKHLVIRAIENKALIAVVTSKRIKNLDIVFKALTKKLNLTSSELGIYQCIKQKDNNVILEGELLHEAGLFELELCINGIELSINPMSFFQVNTLVMQNIYEYVNSLAQGDVVIDAYSGAGLMSAMLAKKNKLVYGIEIVKEATRDADKLKEQNGLSNLININGDAKEILPELAKSNKNFTLVLDPPRKGIDAAVIETIAKSLPAEIIYVSCSPATLARDLKGICLAGYKIESVQPFDMFPETPHVETVVVLKKI